MTRIVSHNATGPLAVPKTSAPGEALYVCRCGLSASPLGLCDGSHKITRDEPSGQVHIYERRDGQLVRIASLGQPLAAAAAAAANAATASATATPLETVGGAN